jgi:hypothetical protein
MEEKLFAFTTVIIDRREINQTLHDKKINNSFWRCLEGIFALKDGLRAFLPCQAEKVVSRTLVMKNIVNTRRKNRLREFGFTTFRNTIFPP